jgi:hypothetical protein
VTQMDSPFYDVLPLLACPCEPTCLGDWRTGNPFSGSRSPTCTFGLHTLLRQLLCRRASSVATANGADDRTPNPPAGLACLTHVPRYRVTNTHTYLEAGGGAHRRRPHSRLPQGGRASQRVNPTISKYQQQPPATRAGECGPRHPPRARWYDRNIRDFVCFTNAEVPPWGA